MNLVNGRPPKYLSIFIYTLELTLVCWLIYILYASWSEHYYTVSSYRLPVIKIKEKNADKSNRQSAPMVTFDPFFRKQATSTTDSTSKSKVPTVQTMLFGTNYSKTGYKSAIVAPSEGGIQQKLMVGDKLPSGEVLTEVYPDKIVLLSDDGTKVLYFNTSLRASFAGVELGKSVKEHVSYSKIRHMSPEAMKSFLSDISLGRVVTSPLGPSIVISGAKDFTTLDKLNLRQGDVLFGFDGTPLLTKVDLENQVHNYGQISDLYLKVYRPSEKSIFVLLIG